MACDRTHAVARPGISERAPSGPGLRCARARGAPLTRDRNQTTQPLPTLRVFDNPAVVSKGWYAVGPAHTLAPGQVRGVTVARQHLVVFRDRSGGLHALDGYCPHMGADLALGTVQGDTLRCFFHHGRFDGTGRCVHSPSLRGPGPERHRVRAWAAAEAYGLLWVFPDPSPPVGVPAFRGLDPDEVVWRLGTPVERDCHHHVCMINGIDVQHLSTVHGIDLSMDVELEEDRTAGQLDITLSAGLRGPGLGRRLLRGALGDRYAYRMRYSFGTVGLLTTNLHTRALGRHPLPPTRMLFAFTPRPEGGTRIQPVFVAPRRTGLRGRILSESLLLAQRIGFAVLRDEDGRVYDHIRFRPDALLPMDGPVARYIAYVNRLPTSDWTAPAPGERP